MSQQMVEYSGEQVGLIKRMICKGGTPDEIEVFLHHCKRTGLDPFAKQIYAIKRWDSEAKREAMAIQVSIDGFRLIAERTGDYDGQDGPYWCGSDGKWVDVWTAQELPFAAKVAVYRKGSTRPFVGIAYYRSCVGLKKDGTPNRFWNLMPEHMLAKCAESMAIRKAFPQELSGLYTAEEMRQDADEVEVVADVNPIVHTHDRQALAAPVGGQHSEPLYQSDDESVTQVQIEKITELLGSLGWSLGKPNTIAKINEITGACITNGGQLRILSADQASDLIERMESAIADKEAKKQAKANAAPVEKTP